LGLVELEGCESGAFVDGVSENERLLFQWLASCNMVRQRIATADRVTTYHFSNQPTLQTGSIVSEQRDIVNSRAEPRHASAVPDNTVESVVRSLLHASKLFLGVQAVAAQLLGQDGESCGVWRVELADCSGLRYDASDDGIFGVGIAVRVGGVTSGRLTPEDHMVWIAASEVLVRLSLAKRSEFAYPKASMFSRSHSTLDRSK
jgi:hypothetical protein